LSRTISEALNAYLRDANEENARGTERGSVLVWTSILDDMMLRLLTKHFVELNSKEREQMFTLAPDRSLFRAGIDRQAGARGAANS
jgi:hypothetical protein